MKIQWSTVSGVARVSCALGQEYALRPIKATEFEVKNWCISAEKAKAKHLL